MTRTRTTPTLIARACPLEDCGGVSGYYGWIEVLADTDHEEHEEVLEWVGGREYRPDHFEAEEVTFTNPKPRLEELRTMFS